MVSVSVPGMYGWGNPDSQLPGALGASPYHRRGLGAPFLLSPSERVKTLAFRSSRPSLPRAALEREGPRTRGIPLSRAPPAPACEPARDVHTVTK